MPFSRRDFLAALGTGGAAVAASPMASLNWPAAEPPRHSRDGFILLNSNENPYGLFPSVLAAGAEGVRLGNRYPFGQEDEFRAQLAAYHKLATPEQVILGEGSTEILRAAVEAFTSPQRKLVTATPTFEAAAFYAQARGAPVAQVPLTSTFAHDLDAMLAAAGSNAGLIYICSPNNPTASLTPRKHIETFISKLPRETYVLIDEAYHHFAGGPDYVSFLEQPVHDPRVIVARTFSKVFGMAGLRLGYGVSAPPALTDTIKKMERRLNFDNASMVALHCAKAAISNEAATRAAITRNAADRSEFLKQASARNQRVISSHANFVMMHTGRPVRDLIQHFRQQGILVGRPFSGMEDYLRVSLGRPEEMRQFWAAWDKLPPTKIQ